MRATIKRYSRSPLVHAIIVALAVAIGIVVALTARRTRGDEIVIASATAASHQL